MLFWRALALPSVQHSRIVLSADCAHAHMEAVSGETLAEVSSFFVDAFWTASTTFGKVELSPRESRQLARQMADDFSSRYGNSWLLGCQNDSLRTIMKMEVTRSLASRYSPELDM